MAACTAAAGGNTAATEAPGNGLQRSQSLSGAPKNVPDVPEAVWKVPEGFWKLRKSFRRPGEAFGKLPPPRSYPVLELDGDDLAPQAGLGELVGDPAGAASSVCYNAVMSTVSLKEL